MEAQVVNPEWIQANRDMISAWSAYRLIWSIHHDLVLSAINMYPIARTHGVTGPGQEQALDALEAKCERIRETVAWVTQEYIKHRFASLTHTDAPEEGQAFISAVMVIRKLHDELQANVPVIDELGKALISGQHGFSNDSQRKTLELAVVLNQKLFAILSCLSIWIAARNISAVPAP